MKHIRVFEIMPILVRVLREDQTLKVWPKGIEERIERKYSDQVRIAHRQAHRKPDRMKVPEGIPSFRSERRVPS
jgi:hypothetical protein